METKIRAATAADIDAISQIAEEAHMKFHRLKPDYFDKTSAHNLANRYKSLMPVKDFLLLVASSEVEGKEQVVGFAGAYLKQTKGGYLKYDLRLVVDNVVVAPAHRNKGTGTKLMKSLILIAKQKDAELVELETPDNNAEALSIYRQLGFGVVTQKMIYKMPD